jgi:hypothetical protein
MNELKKKKKGQFTIQVLDLDFCSLNQNDKIEILKVINRKLMVQSRLLLGKDNSITIMELFLKIYGFSFNSVEIYKGIFLLDLLKRCVKQLRRDMIVYFILLGSKVFVLQSQEESNMYKKFLDRDIANLQKTKINADKWVRGKMWKSLL